MERGEKPEKKVIRIAIVDNDPLRFVGFHSLLDSEPDFRVQASDFTTIVNDLQSDVILLGTRGGAATYETMAALKAARPDVLMIVTGPDQSDDVILRAISAGAKGFLNESAPPSEYKHAIREVCGGSVWAPRRVLAKFIERTTAAPRTTTPENPVLFSDRERQVLQLLVDGCSNREIGDRLGIEERTVKAHIARLMQKVGVSNRIALSVHAVTHAILGGE